MGAAPTSFNTLAQHRQWWDLDTDTKTRRERHRRFLFCQQYIYMAYDFRAVKRWAKCRLHTRHRHEAAPPAQNVNIFDTTDLLFFPVNHHDEHWSLMVASAKEKCIRHCDSPSNRAAGLAAFLLMYLHDHAAAAHRKWLDISEWTYVPSRAGLIPQQDNMFDCGTFVCMYADMLSAGISPSTHQASSLQQSDARRGEQTSRAPPCPTTKPAVGIAGV